LILHMSRFFRSSQGSLGVNQFVHLAVDIDPYLHHLLYEVDRFVQDEPIAFAGPATIIRFKIYLIFSCLAQFFFSWIHLWEIGHGMAVRVIVSLPRDGQTFHLASWQRTVSPEHRLLLRFMPRASSLSARLGHVQTEF
jgi:hypothetical protein